MPNYIRRTLVISGPSFYSERLEKKIYDEINKEVEDTELLLNNKVAELLDKYNLDTDKWVIKFEK